MIKRGLGIQNPKSQNKIYFKNNLPLNFQVENFEKILNEWAPQCNRLRLFFSNQYLNESDYANIDPINFTKLFEKCKFLNLELRTLAYVAKFDNSKHNRFVFNLVQHLIEVRSLINQRL